MLDIQTYKDKGCTEEFCARRFRVSLVITKELETTLLCILTNGILLEPNENHTTERDNCYPENGLHFMISTLLVLTGKKKRFTY